MTERYPPSFWIVLVVVVTERAKRREALLLVVSSQSFFLSYHSLLPPPFVVDYENVPRTPEIQFSWPPQITQECQLLVEEHPV